MLERPNQQKPNCQGRRKNRPECRDTGKTMRIEII